MNGSGLRGILDRNPVKTSKEKLALGYLRDTVRSERHDVWKRYEEVYWYLNFYYG